MEKKPKLPNTQIPPGIEARFSGVNFTQMRLHDLLKAADTSLISIEVTPSVDDLLAYRAILKTIATEIEPLVPDALWNAWLQIFRKSYRAIQSRQKKWLTWAADALWTVHRYIIDLLQDYHMLYKLKKRRTLTDDTSVLEKYVEAEIR